MESIGGSHELGPDHHRISEYATDVVETLLVRPPGLHGALSRFGSRLGAEGWSLENVSAWVDELGEIAPATSTTLRSFDAGVALANGWTEGHLRGLRAEECFDAVTGLCTTAILRLRLQQLFEQCTALEIEPNWLHALVIFDADLDVLGSLEADAAMMTLADVVQRSFTFGETIIRDHNRVFVLCIRDEHLNERVSTLIDQMSDRALLRDARVLGWVDNLPDNVGTIDRYMADLAV